MIERFMVDDAGTLIDIVTGENYDIVEDVVEVLNVLNCENERLRKPVKFANDVMESLRYINEELKKELDMFKPFMCQDIGEQTNVLLYVKKYGDGDFERCIYDD